MFYETAAVGRGAEPRCRRPGPAQPAGHGAAQGLRDRRHRLEDRNGAKSGSLFLTDRRARVELRPGDIDPASGPARLSYRQAADLFKAASGGATLHQLRHSALTHDAKDGASTPTLMSKSGQRLRTDLSLYRRPLQNLF